MRLFIKAFISSSNAVTVAGRSNQRNNTRVHSPFAFSQLARPAQTTTTKPQRARFLSLSSLLQLNAGIYSLVASRLRIATADKRPPLLLLLLLVAVLFCVSKTSALMWSFRQNKNCRTLPSYYQQQQHDSAISTTGFVVLAKVSKPRNRKFLMRTQPIEHSRYRTGRRSNKSVVVAAAAGGLVDSCAEKHRSLTRH